MHVQKNMLFMSKPCVKSHVVTDASLIHKRVVRRSRQFQTSARIRGVRWQEQTCGRDMHTTSKRNMRESVPVMDKTYTKDNACVGKNKHLDAIPVPLRETRESKPVKDRTFEQRNSRLSTPCREACLTDRRTRRTDLGQSEELVGVPSICMAPLAADALVVTVNKTETTVFACCDQDGAVPGVQAGSVAHEGPKTRHS